MWRPIMDGKATWRDMMENDIYWLLDLNEAMDVWQDMNDLDLRPPIAPGANGTSTVRFSGL